MVFKIWYYTGRRRFWHGRLKRPVSRGDKWFNFVRDNFTLSS